MVSSFLNYKRHYCKLQTHFTIYEYLDLKMFFPSWFCSLEQIWCICKEVSFVSFIQDFIFIWIYTHIRFESFIGDFKETFFYQQDRGRYHEDIFGITLRTAEIHSKSRATARRRMASQPWKSIYDFVRPINNNCVPNWDSKAPATKGANTI